MYCVLIVRGVKQNCIRFNYFTFEQNLNQKYQLFKNVIYQKLGIQQL